MSCVVSEWNEVGLLSVNPVFRFFDSICHWFPQLIDFDNEYYDRLKNKMDRVYIRDLKIQTVIGIFDWERAIKQTVSLDLEMAADIRKAAASDHIADALDYKAVAKRIIRFVEDSEFQLVETMAEQVSVIVLQEFKVPWLQLRVSKPGALRGAQDVGVVIERGEKP